MSRICLVSIKLYVEIVFAKVLGGLLKTCYEVNMLPNELFILKK